MINSLLVAGASADRRLDAFLSSATLYAAEKSNGDVIRSMLTANSKINMDLGGDCTVLAEKNHKFASFPGATLNTNETLRLGVEVGLNNVDDLAEVNVEDLKLRVRCDIWGGFVSISPGVWPELLAFLGVRGRRPRVLQEYP